MKIYAISDLHLAISCNKPMNIYGGEWENYMEKITADWNERVTDQDIILVSGDISWAMKLDDAASDLKVFEGLKGRKVIIRGNHDYWWSSYSKVRSILPSGMVAIQNNAQLIDGIIFCGTRGWTVPSNNRATDPHDLKVYEHELLRLDMTLTEAKRLQTDNQPIILMMHYPPYNWAYESSGFTDIIDRYNITAVVYGHLHGKDGGGKLTIVKRDLPYFLTSCDQLKNKLQLIYDCETCTVNIPQDCITIAPNPSNNSGSAALDNTAVSSDI